MKPQTAAIIGGGIAGPVLAMALQRVGIHATVYEAYTEPAAHVGSFLNVASNGMDALATVGLADQVARAGLATPRMVMWSGTGKRLGEVANGVRLSTGITSTTIQRGRLHQLLLDELRRRDLPVVHGRRLTDATTGDGVARASFEDGTSVEADLLIGADGVHSRLRTIIDPSAPPPRYCGLLSLGGHARDLDLPAEPGTFHMIFGRHGFFSYTVQPNGEVWWFANLPQAREPARGELAATPSATWQQRLLTTFAADRAPARDILQRTTGHIGAYALHDLPHVATWHRDRMVLVGDAAHATSPSAGQGASMAIEGALVLARALRDLDDHRQALRGYEHVRRPRVERIVRYSARISGSKTAGPVGRVLRDAVMPLALRWLAKPEQHAWMYRHHIAWDRDISNDLAATAAN
ncbi:FAD-dependent monooxygenase [Egicoccus sp. AB-alg2]|uniref:FAD-dependent monooxygenase n=1 Tax=Egicoccus sp. AB-alg2 TaxID=3242693 RepID=UPI00359E4FC9